MSLVTTPFEDTEETHLPCTYNCRICSQIHLSTILKIDKVLGTTIGTSFLWSTESTLLSQSQRSVPVRTLRKCFIAAGKGTYNVFRTRVFYTKHLKRDHPNVRISIESTLFSCHLVLCRLWGHEQYHNFQIPSHRKFEIVQHHFRSSTLFERIYLLSLTSSSDVFIR